MAKNIETQVGDIRAASRLLVRQLGFMSRNVAGTDLSPSAVHAIVEIAASKTVTAKDLGTLLLLEKSTVSRLVKSLANRSLVTETPTKDDARVKILSLTSEGQRMLRTIDRFAETKVSDAIAPLENVSRELILEGLQLFSDALASCQDDKTPTERVAISIAQVTELPAIGELMANAYEQLDGFPSREEQPDYYAQFSQLDTLVASPHTEVVVARSVQNEVLGGVVYIGDMSAYGAGGDATTSIANASAIRLLATSPGTRGLGLGRALTDFCIKRARESGRSRIILHSTRFMPAAWHLYEQIGFVRFADIDFKQEDLDVLGFELVL